jgi:hypothetical protein
LSGVEDDDLPPVARKVLSEEELTRAEEEEYHEFLFDELAFVQQENEIDPRQQISGGEIGWYGEQYVTYVQDDGEPMVLGFGDTPHESKKNAVAQIEYAGITDKVDVDGLLTARIELKA